MKILTVAMPSYNVEEFLEKGLSTFADDRFSDSLDIIIVDDGSTDRTAEIADAFVLRYPKIFRVIHKENGGHGSAVNVGINNAKGKYFRIVDGDDMVDTENLLKLLSHLETQDCDIVVTPYQKINIESNEVFPQEFSPLIECGKKYEFDKLNPIIGIEFICLAASCIRTQFLWDNKITLQEKTFFVDSEYILMATALCETIVCYDLNIYRYFVGNVNQSVNSQNMVKRYDDHDRVVRRCIMFIKDNKFSNERLNYCYEKILLLVWNQMTISLIYDTDRKRGLKRNREFRRFIKMNSQALFSRYSKRCFIYSTLHFLHFNEKRFVDTKTSVKNLLGLNKK